MGTQPPLRNCEVRTPSVLLISTTGGSCSPPSVDTSRTPVLGSSHVGSLSEASSTTLMAWAGSAGRVPQPARKRVAPGVCLLASTIDITKPSPGIEVPPPMRTYSLRCRKTVRTHPHSSCGFTTRLNSTEPLLAALTPVSDTHASPRMPPPRGCSAASPRSSAPAPSSVRVTSGTTSLEHTCGASTGGGGGAPAVSDGSSPGE